MKKISKLLFLAIVALGVSFTACNNDNLPDGPDAKEGNTHVSVTLRLASNGSRAAHENNDQDFNFIGDWAGNDVYSSVTVYLVDGSSVTKRKFNVGTANGEYTQDGTILKPNAGSAIKTTAGIKTVYVVVNETAQVTAALNKTSVHEFEQAYKEVALLLTKESSEADDVTLASKIATVDGGKDAIVMTSVNAASIDVKANVSEDQTLSATAGSNDHALNSVTLEVERAAARALVTIEKTEFIIPDPNPNGASNLGTLKDITWALAQGEQSLFVQRKKDNPWEWATPNWDFVPGDGTAQYYSQAGDKYDYSGLFKTDDDARNHNGVVIPTKGAYTNSAEDVGAHSVLKGEFILPNTHLYATAPTIGDTNSSYQGGYKKGNTAYVLVRATFVPEATAFADGGTYTEGENFYVAEGKFFKSSQAAYDATGSTEITKYENGKVLYFAWVNPDNATQGNWYNSPVLRNNIYHIHITGFKNLGTNWNPLFPEDPKDYELVPNEDFDPNEPIGPDNEPFIPKDPSVDPKNPDPKPQPEPVVPADPDEDPILPEEPKNPIDPEDPLTTSETWMSVDVKVLPWKVHSYQVDLGI